MRISIGRAADGPARITVGVAALTWVISWLAGNFVGAAVVDVLGGQGDSTTPIWVTLVGAIALWVPMIAGLVAVSRRFGVDSLSIDFGFRFRAVDVVGVPIGVFSQLVLVRAVYLPLEQWWPATFSSPVIEKSARTLYESANGAWMVGLVLIVVIGAPVVEELLYRGLLQGALSRRTNNIVAVVAVAALFAIIHFRPVEYPGLFAVGLVFGTCALATGRLGLGIVTHAAFNATGLIWVATR